MANETSALVEESYETIVPPFSVAAMRDNDEAGAPIYIGGSNDGLKLFDSNIPDLQAALRVCRAQMEFAPARMRGWHFIVSDATGERVHIATKG